MIERQRASVGHLPEQDWSLRVKLVYRRRAEGKWKLAHWYTDPIVRAINLEKAAAIARCA